MHAVLHKSFKEFVEVSHSRPLYLKMLAKAGFDEEQFEADHYHNDAEIDQLLDAAGDLLSQSRMDFLTDMGTYGAPGLLEQFSGFLEPDWDVLDLVENVEPRMHKYVSEELGAFPPALKTERISKDQLQVDVLSHRKMAGLAKGFITGFAAHYGDKINIDVETSESGYRFVVTKQAA